MKKTCIILFLFSLNFFVYSQKPGVAGAPEIGKPCPSFQLERIDHFKSEKISISELKGKYVILDFWSLACTSCITSFRKADSLQRKFSKQVQFLLIGQDQIWTSAVVSARTAFEKYRRKWNLNLSAAYDQALFKKMDISFVPYFIWIDKNGIVQALTTSAEVNETNLTAFINGKEIVTEINLPEPTIPLDYNRPLLINGNGGADTVFLFRSVLASWNPASPMSGPAYITSETDMNGRSFHSAIRKNRVQVNGVSLRHLIEMAYGDTVQHGPAWYFRGDSASNKFYARTSYGRYWLRPILEVNDSALFDLDLRTGKNAWSYSLTVPREKGTADFLRKAMQRDLSVYFGYDITVETRTMPCWNLKATEIAKSKLKTKGGKPYNLGSFAELKMVNIPVYELIRHVSNFSQPSSPIVDMTGITGHIDMELNATMMDFADVRRALASQGLILEKGTKETKVIFVRGNRQ